MLGDVVEQLGVGFEDLLHLLALHHLAVFDRLRSAFIFGTFAAIQANGQTRTSLRSFSARGHSALSPRTLWEDLI